MESVLNEPMTYPQIHECRRRGGPAVGTESKIGAHPATLPDCLVAWYLNWFRFADSCCWLWLGFMFALSMVSGVQYMINDALLDTCLIGGDRFGPGYATVGGLFDFNVSGSESSSVTIETTQLSGIVSRLGTGVDLASGPAIETFRNWSAFCRGRCSTVVIFGKHWTTLIKMQF